MTLQLTISLLWSAYLATLAVWIILQKRSPVSTMGWLLTLGALPYLGFAIYYFLGPQHVIRRRLRRERSKHSLARLRGQALAATQDLPARSQQMSTLILASTGMPPTTCTDIELLVRGGATYEAIFAAIRAAQHHVHLEYYIYEPDRIGTALRDLLVEKARQGVQVRLLLDALGCKRLNQRFLQPLQAAGGHTAFFHQVSFRRFRPVINLRTHRKIVVCDGRVGFTGGINVTDTQDERVNARAFHDLHLRLEGQAVLSLQQIFLEDWYYTTEEALKASAYTPELPAGPHPIHIIPSGPDFPWEPLHRVYLTALHTARERIWLTTPYFVPTEPLLFALTSAGLRGIDVRVLVPRRSDSYFVTAAARSYFDELTRAGVQVWEYTERMLHAKALVVDDQFAIVGTANFDSRSFRLNFEVTALGYAPEMAARLAQQFEADLNRARRVPKERRTRPWERLAEATTRLFSPLL